MKEQRDCHFSGKWKPPDFPYSRLMRLFVGPMGFPVADRRGSGAGDRLRPDPAEDPLQKPNPGLKGDSDHR